MNQETYNFWGIILQIAGVVVSAGVGGIVWWYTVETRKLRIESEKQVGLFAQELKIGERQVGLFTQQLKMSIKPYLIGSIQEYYPGGTRVQNTAVASVKAGYVCPVANHTDRTAHQVFLLLRNQATGFFFGDFVADVVSRSPLNFRAEGPCIMDDAEQQVRNVYGIGADALLQRLRLETQDYLAVFFRDIDGDLYVAVRSARLTSTDIRRLGVNRIIEAN
jgi:hypothetical protein